MKKRVIAVIAVLALSVAMFGCKAGSDTGNGKKQSLPQARTAGFVRRLQFGYFRPGSLAPQRF